MRCSPNRIGISEEIERIRSTRPLIHHITNWVTIYDCAQITRAVGALPVMAHAEEEVEEMVCLASALVLNIGTLTTDLIEAMILAGRRANERGIPVVLDAVGAGATALRTRSALKIMNAVDVDVIKGNAGEVATLAGTRAEVKGVESISVDGHIESVATDLAERRNAVVLVTGAVDLVTDGERIAEVRNGHPMMGAVVGTGCMAASVTGAFTAVSSDALLAASRAMASFGIAGEKAAKDANGPMDFKMRLMDEMSSLNERDDGRVRIVLTRR